MTPPPADTPPSPSPDDKDPAWVEVFQVQTVVEATPEELFSFHENPQNLTVVMPPTSRLVHLECEPHARPGGIIVLEMREMGFVPLRWRCRWNRVERPGLLVDEITEGPFRRFVHHHRFEDIGGGRSRMVDEVHYSFGRGAWGRLVSKTGLKVYLHLMFAWRHRQTRRYFAAQRPLS